MNGLLLVGRVARAHGNKGQVIVNPETDFLHERFAPGNVLVVEHRGSVVERTIRTVRFQDGRPIIGLDGIATMNDAEALAGAELKMPASALGPLPGNTYYRHDLVGCEVVDVSGAAVGKVTDVQGPIERCLLVVGEGRDEVLIPMIDGIIVRVELTVHRIVVSLPEGLSQLNRATRTSGSE